MIGCMVCSCLQVTTPYLIFVGLSRLSLLFRFYEARAILLGRLGRHDPALELYVYRLRNYLKVEQ